MLVRSAEVEKRDSGGRNDRATQSTLPSVHVTFVFPEGSRGKHSANLEASPVQLIRQFDGHAFVWDLSDTMGLDCFSSI